MRSLLRYCSCHSNMKFISSRHRVISFMYFLYPMIKILLLTLLEFEIKKKWHSILRQRKYQRRSRKRSCNFGVPLTLNAPYGITSPRKMLRYEKCQIYTLIWLTLLNSSSCPNWNNNYGLACAFSSAADQLYIARYSLWNRKLPSQSPILIPRWM